MSLADIIARKKAQEAANPNNPNNPAPVATPAPVTQEIKTIAEPVKQEQPAIAPEKPLSFAEKMALKRQKEEAEKNKSEPAPSVIVAAVEQKPEPDLRTGILTAATDPNPMPAPDKPAPELSADPATAQAYADIKTRIERLSEASDMDIENAMSDLKKALLANPAACSLIGDSDIGQMVIALRRITGEAIADAAKEKKPGRKKGSSNAQVDLSDATQVAAIFDEL